MANVLVGMSGGIDSSVAAYLLKKEGHNVTAVTMTVWKESLKHLATNDSNSCFSPDKSKDIAKTKEICEKLGIEHTVLDISDLYEKVVLGNFKDEYLHGRTPNPCVWCNQKIKFGAMVEEAKRQGLVFDYFATGHYAQIEEKNGRFALKRGVDPVKDQSYFLYRLSQEQLGRTLFPLGKMNKTDVRQIDFDLGFHEANQSESQDFYSGKYTDLLDVEPKIGDIVDTNGKVLGKHNGMWNYTIGQRKGLGIAAPFPLYVIELDPANNRVVVGYEDKTNNNWVLASNINWVAVDHIDGEIKASAKIRSTSKPIPCTVSAFDGKLKAIFDEPVKAATCGQSLVIYDNDTVLAGGIIEQVDGR